MLYAFEFIKKITTLTITRPHGKIELSLRMRHNLLPHVLNITKRRDGEVMLPIKEIDSSLSEICRTTPKDLKTHSLLLFLRCRQRCLMANDVKWFTAAV